MNIKTIFCVTAMMMCTCILQADDLREDISIEDAIDKSSGIYIAHAMTDKDEIYVKKIDASHKFNYQYRRWIITDIIKDEIGIHKDDMVQIAEPYQKMEYDRAQLYLEKGIDEGLIEEYYTSEDNEYNIIKDRPVIVFVIGDAPGNLVYTARNAREAVKNSEKIKSLIKRKKLK